MPSFEELQKKYNTVQQPEQQKVNRNLEDIANEMGVILSQKEPKIVEKKEDRSYFEKAKEAYKQANPLEVAKGAARGAASTAYGMGTLLEKASAKMTGQKPLGETIAGKEVEKPKSLTFTGQDTLGSKIGFAGEQMAEYFAPGTVPLKVANTLQKGIKTARLAKAMGLFGRVATEAALVGGQTAVQQGEFGQEAKSAAMFGAAIPVAGKVIPKVYKFAKVGAKGLVGKATGAGVAALEEAYSNPNVIKFAREAGAEGAEGLQRKAVEAGKEGLEKLLQERSVAYTSKLDKIKTIKTQLDDIATNLRDKAKILMSKDKFDIKLIPTDELGKKTNVIDFSKSVITESQPTVEKALNDVFTWTDWTPRGMDLLKKRLNDFKRQTKPGTPARALVNDLWFGLREQLEDKVPGYKEMTKEYNVISELIEDMTSALSLGEKAKLDTSVRKFMSIMRDNNEVRKGFAKQLGELAKKDITGMMAGAQLAPSMPRGLAGGTVSLGTGALGAANLLNPATLPATLVYLAGSSPRLVGELVNLLGKGGRMLDKAKMSPALGNALKRIFGDIDDTSVRALPSNKLTQTIEDVGEKGLEFARKPKIGLGIEDVTKRKDKVVKEPWFTYQANNGKIKKAPSEVNEYIDDILDSARRRTGGEPQSTAEVATEMLIDGNDYTFNKWFDEKYRGNEFNLRQDLETYFTENIEYFTPKKNINKTERSLEQTIKETERNLNNPAVGQTADKITSVLQENIPYEQKRYFIGLQGDALKKFEKTGKIPKAKQAFGGEFSITDDYQLAKQYTGKEGKVIEVKPKAEIEIGISSMDDGLLHDISDIGDGEYLVGGNYAIEIVSPRALDISSKQPRTLGKTKAVELNSYIDPETKTMVVSWIKNNGKKGLGSETLLKSAKESGAKTITLLNPNENSVRMVEKLLKAKKIKLVEKPSLSGDLAQITKSITIQPI